MIQERHRGSQWAVFYEIHDSTGAGQRGSCDAMAFNLWPSQGFEIHGFEIKVSRSDFQNEIRNPDKSERFKRFCDRWWLVGSSRSIVKGDLPEGWGFMWARSGKLVVSKGAPKLEPEPIPIGMRAAILRRAAEGNTPAAVQQKWREIGVEQGKHQAEQKIIRLQRSLDHAQGMISTFQEATGIEMSTYKHDGPKIGKAVAAVLKLHSSGYQGLGQLAYQAQKTLKQARHALEQVDQLQEVAAEILAAAPADQASTLTQCIGGHCRHYRVEGVGASCELNGEKVMGESSPCTFAVYLQEQKNLTPA
jgi:hypothetical protein